MWRLRTPTQIRLAADGPGRVGDPIGARPGDVHPAGRDRVSGQDLPPGPFAGDDHTSGRAEHGPFRALGPGIVVGVDGGGQWHVQQHRQTHPPGVGQQLRGGRRGDEPVDQDRLTVGNGGDDAGQVGAGARGATGHVAATVATSTSQPASASPAQTRRS